MNILKKIEAQGRSALTAIEHGAAYLVGLATASETSLAKMEAASPLVAEAVGAGKAYAAVHGIPVQAIEGAGQAVLEAAKALAAGLTQTGAVPDAPAAASVGAAAAV